MATYRIGQDRDLDANDMRMPAYTSYDRIRDHALRMSGIVTWEYSIFELDAQTGTWVLVETCDRRVGTNRPTPFCYLHGPTSAEIRAALVGDARGALGYGSSSTPR